MKMLKKYYLLISKTFYSQLEMLESISASWEENLIAKIFTKTNRFMKIEKKYNLGRPKTICRSRG